MFEKKCKHCDQPLRGLNIGKKTFCSDAHRFAYHNARKDWKAVNEKRKEKKLEKEHEEELAKQEGDTTNGSSN